MKKISILGAGSWGTALAMVLANNKNHVSIWTLDDKQCKEVKESNINEKYLPGIILPKGIDIDTNIENVIKDSSIIVLAVPSQAIRGLLQKYKKYINENHIIVNVAKGLEKRTGLRLSEVCKEELPCNKYVMLSGPSHAEEVALNLPTTVVASSENIESAKYIQDIFMNSNFRIYTNTDIIGVEVGGALKNIIAFGAGISDGIGFGDNTKAALITRGMKEISRLGVAMGGEEGTFSGLTGMGDMIVTCTSIHSRNRKAGYLIGQGKTVSEALNEVGMVVEGITATEAAYHVAKKLNIDMPITNAIYSLLYNGGNAREIVENLMIRDKKMEDVNF